MQPESPYFSVIIPTYNRSGVLGRTIDSVVAQTFGDWELIVVDDGSTDDTASLVKSFADSRIRYRYQENAERGAARNTGIDMAGGEWICFLDSDDCFLPDHLQGFSDEISRVEKGPAMFINRHRIVYPDRKEEVPLELKGNSALKYLIKYPVIPSRVCIAASILKQHIRFEEDRSCIVAEDSIAFAKIAVRFPVHFMDRVGVEYYLHGDNSVELKNNPGRNMLNAFRRLFEDELVRRELTPAFRSNLFSILRYKIACYHESRSEWSEMGRQAWWSLMANPCSRHARSALLLWLRSHGAGRLALKMSGRG